MGLPSLATWVEVVEEPPHCPTAGGDGPPAVHREVLWGHCTGDSSCPCSPGWRPRGPSPPRPPTPGKRSGLREAGGCRSTRTGTGKGLGCCRPCPSQSHAAPASSCELPLPATPMLAPCAKQGGQDPAIVPHGDVHRMVPHREKLSGGPPFAPSWQDRLLLVSPHSLVLPAHHSPMGDGDRTRPRWHGARVPIRSLPLSLPTLLRLARPPPRQAMRGRSRNVSG